MKAIVCTRYGPPEALQLREVETPIPAENEVLIKVHAATVTTGDCELRSMDFPVWFQIPLRLYLGVRRPSRVQVLGQELAGEIEAVGRAVTRFKKGDRVFAPTFFRLGAYAEYTCLPEKDPILKPDSIPFAEAATIPTGGISGLHFLKVANIRAGERVLINGAGGSIGTYAVQLAKLLAAEVTAVDSTGKLDMLRSIGADRVIDFTEQDFTGSGESYDVIIDVIGKSPFSRSVKALRPKGRYVLGNPIRSGMIRGRLARMTEGRQVIVATADYRPEDFKYLTGLMESGRIRPVLDRVYPLEQTAAAHRYVEQGHKQGNVIIQVEQR